MIEPDRVERKSENELVNDVRERIKNDATIIGGIYHYHKHRFNYELMYLLRHSVFYTWKVYS